MTDLIIVRGIVHPTQPVLMIPLYDLVRLIPGFRRDHEELHGPWNLEEKLSEYESVHSISGDNIT